MTQGIKQPTLLAGEWVGSEDDEWFEDRDPAHPGETIALLPRLGEAQVANAIEHAVAVAPEWAGLSTIDRGRVLFQAARLLRERIDDIATDICREAGKLIREARGEILKSADFLEYYAGLGRAAQGEILPDERPGTFTYAISEPLGVVALITAWNDPMLTPARKLGPALMAGNAVALKPAEDTPLAAIHLARALVDGGLPSGALNVVVGEPRDVAAPLLDHPAVKAVSFTGSTATGMALREQLASSNVRFQAELGGKNAAVVLDGADLDAAVATIAAGAYAQAGQRCTATSRVVVQAPLAADLAERLVDAAGSLKVGPGLDEASEMGPLINSRQYDKVSTALTSGVSEGGELLGGGQKPGGNLADGYFLEPAVLKVASSGDSVWQEEIFGPVVAVATVEDVDGAVAAVNDSRYGLSAAVFTNDLDVAMRFAKEADTGQVAINRPTSGWDVHLPFGGFKDSGSMSKEQGTDALSFYTRVKTVAVGYER